MITVVVPSGSPVRSWTALAIAFRPAEPPPPWQAPERRAAHRETRTAETWRRRFFPRLMEGDPRRSRYGGTDEPGDGRSSVPVSSVRHRRLRPGHFHVGVVPDLGAGGSAH